MMKARIALLCVLLGTLGPACGESPSHSLNASSRPEPTLAKESYPAKHLPNLGGGARYLTY